MKPGLRPANWTMRRLLSLRGVSEFRSWGERRIGTKGTEGTGPASKLAGTMQACGHYRGWRIEPMESMKIALSA